MKRYGRCILLSLIMITTTMAGCLEGDSDEASIAGKWYIGEEVVVEFNDDGTITDNGEVEAHWSVDGDIVTIVDVDTPEDPEDMYFHMSDGWLFIAETSGDDCSAFSGEIIGNSTVFFEISNNLTLPSFCTTIWGSMLADSNEGDFNDGTLNQYKAEDHVTSTTNASDDNLVRLSFINGTDDLQWSFLIITLFDEESGTTYKCSPGDDECDIGEELADTVWGGSEVIVLREGGLTNICGETGAGNEEGSSCDLKVSMQYKGKSIAGTSEAVAVT